MATTPQEQQQTSTVIDAALHTEAIRILECQGNYFSVLNIEVQDAIPKKIVKRTTPLHNATTPTTTVKSLGEVTDKQVHKSFRLLAARLHPDKYDVEVSSDETQDKKKKRQASQCTAAFKEVVNARDALHTPQGRLTHYARHYKDTPRSTFLAGSSTDPDKPQYHSNRASSFAAWAKKADEIRQADKKNNSAATMGHQPVKVNLRAMSGVGTKKPQRPPEETERREREKKLAADPLRKVMLFACRGVPLSATMAREEPPTGVSAGDQRQCPMKSSTHTGTRRKWSDALDSSDDDDLPRARGRWQ